MSLSFADAKSFAPGDGRLVAHMACAREKTYVPKAQETSRS